MDFGGRPDDPGGKDDNFDPRGTYAKLSAYNTNNKGLRTAYNRKLEKLLAATAESVTLGAEARERILADVHTLLGGNAW